jgi:REP element-mobilizing transposase RayT
MDSDRVFFVTTVTCQRFPIFRREATAELLIHTLSHYRDAGKFLLHEFVIMPDHVHVLLTPAQEISLERAMQFIKGGFSFRMKERGSIWQPSFTNHSHPRLGGLRAPSRLRLDESRAGAAGPMSRHAIPHDLVPSYPIIVLHSSSQETFLPPAALLINAGACYANRPRQAATHCCVDDGKPVV